MFMKYFPLLANYLKHKDSDFMCKLMGRRSFFLFLGDLHLPVFAWIWYNDYKHVSQFHKIHSRTVFFHFSWNLSCQIIHLYNEIFQKTAFEI